MLLGKGPALGCAAALGEGELEAVPEGLMGTGAGLSIMVGQAMRCVSPQGMQRPLLPGRGMLAHRADRPI
jgi:hypothetical protein